MRLRRSDCNNKDTLLRDPGEWNCGNSSLNEHREKGRGFILLRCLFSQLVTLIKCTNQWAANGSQHIHLWEMCLLLSWLYVCELDERHWEPTAVPTTCLPPPPPPSSLQLTSRSTSGPPALSALYKVKVTLLSACFCNSRTLLLWPCEIIWRNKDAE